MAVRIVVCNTDEAYGPDLRASLLGVKGLKIIAEVDEPALLVQALDRFSCDVLVVHLDPAPESMLHLLSEVLNVRPTLPIFAISESTDGQLILAAIRKGISEFIPKPLDGAIVAEAFGKVAQRNASNREPGKLITVIGGSGGVGVTTLAVNLAVELQQLDCGKVTIVDLDHRFGQVSTLLDVEPHYTMADLCQSTEQLDPMMVDRALVKHSSGLHVLSRPTHFAQADDITAAHCVGVLSALTQLSDYVICDGPTRFDFGARAVLDLADYNLLVLQLAVPTVRNLHRMIEGMVQVGYSMERMRLICNRVGADGGGISLSDVQATLRLPVFAEVVDDSSVVFGASNIGEPLFSAAPRSKVRLSIKALAEQMYRIEHGADAEENVDGGKKKGLLAKIFE